MVESKVSIYDSDDGAAPLVPVEQVSVDPERVLLLDAERADDTSSPSIVAEAAAALPASPSSSRSILSAEEDPSVSVSEEAIPAEVMPEEEYQRQRLVGTGVASGVVGLLLGGPILAMLLGFGATYAYDKEGAAGDTARAVGDVALSARDKAREVESKHNLVHKSTKAAAVCWDKAKELDRRHNILENSKSVATRSFQASVEFTRRHRLIERCVESVGKSLYWTADKLAKVVENKTTTQPTRTEESAQQA